MKNLSLFLLATLLITLVAQAPIFYNYPITLENQPIFPKKIELPSIGTVHYPGHYIGDKNPNVKAGIEIGAQFAAQMAFEQGIWSSLVHDIKEVYNVTLESTFIPVLGVFGDLYTFDVMLNGSSGEPDIRAQFGELYDNTDSFVSFDVLYCKLETSSTSSINATTNSETNFDYIFEPGSGKNKSASSKILKWFGKTLNVGKLYSGDYLLGLQGWKVFDYTQMLDDANFLYLMKWGANYTLQQYSEQNVLPFNSDLSTIQQIATVYKRIYDSQSYGYRFDVTLGTDTSNSVDDIPIYVERIIYVVHYNPVTELLKLDYWTMARIGSTV